MDRCPCQRRSTTQWFRASVQLLPLPILAPVQATHTGTCRSLGNLRRLPAPTTGCRQVSGRSPEPSYPSARPARGRRLRADSRWLEDAFAVDVPDLLEASPRRKGERRSVVGIDQQRGTEQGDLCF